MRKLTSCTKHEVIDGVEIFRHDVLPPFGMTFFIEVRVKLSFNFNGFFLWSMLKGWGFEKRVLIESNSAWKNLPEKNRQSIKDAVDKFLEQEV